MNVAAKATALQDTQHYIGLMSGTSLDGCDAALVAITGDKVELVHFLTLPMPESLKGKVQDACSIQRSTVQLICEVNVELGLFFAQAAKELCAQAGFDISKVCAIASHGQTVWHIPPYQGQTASTLQLGEPAVIAYHTGVPVVSGMRAMDMAAGGQGAPLVPLSEYLIYRRDTDLALQNLGGIGNVTVLPANCTLEQVFAFDTGPGNLILDGFAKHLFNQPFDQDGSLSSPGQVIQELLASWMAMPYIQALIPKSTGREVFGEAFVKEQLHQNIHQQPHDLMATAAAFTAHSMRKNYDLYVFPRCPNLAHLVLGGGGAHNPTLRRNIQDLFPGVLVQTQEDVGYSSDAKEAVAFALIGRQTMDHLPGNVPAATGAKQAVPLGSITWPPGYENPAHESAYQGRTP